MTAKLLSRTRTFVPYIAVGRTPPKGVQISFWSQTTSGTNIGHFRLDVMNQPTNLCGPSLSKYMWVGISVVACDDSGGLVYAANFNLPAKIQTVARGELLALVHLIRMISI